MQRGMQAACDLGHLLSTQLPHVLGALPKALPDTLV